MNPDERFVVADRNHSQTFGDNHDYFVNGVQVPEAVYRAAQIRYGFETSWRELYRDARLALPSDAEDEDE